jgi:hypothetical protein
MDLQMMENKTRCGCSGSSGLLDNINLMSYDSFNGTSIAPAITGLIMLLQYYKNLNGVF